MTLANGKQISTRLLIIYMISAVLFLSSIELHIHTHEAAATADHGFAVSITSLPDNLADINNAHEIEVSPDGMLHAHYSTPEFLSIFLLLILIVAVFSQICIIQTRNAFIHFKPRYFVTPLLRAPPH